VAHSEEDMNLIECVRTLVTIQMKDLPRSLHGTGNFRLTGPFVRHRVTYQVWQAMSDERKESAYNQSYQTPAVARQR